MLYLVLAIASSALLAVIMRVSERYSRNDMTMLAANYLMCALASVAYAGGVSMPADTTGMGLTVGVGLVNGALYLAGFVLLKWNITRSGVVLPSTFMKLGVLVPTVAAMLIFGEQPRITQLIGVAVALGAILLIQGVGGKGEGSGGLGGLILLMLCGGTADTMSKVYETWGNPALKNHFLLFTFLVALMLCAALCILRRQKVTLMDALWGLLLGVPNYYSARFLLLSLEEVSAVVAYPTFSVGTIVLVTLVGALIFREKLGRRKMAALGMVMAALALMNV